MNNTPDPAANAATAQADAAPARDVQWYKDAIIYQLHVKAFADSNGDGIGDLRGLIQRLDYVHDLGVNTVWLLPFYPSPLRDDGYDIADYRSIHPDYGKLRDFREFVREAHRRGLRVITELVINHTSDQHPWFQAARRARRGSNKHDFYVWSDTDQRYQGTRIIFTDTESSNWAWDPIARRYYWHRFFSHQPDLNFDNPAVTRAVISVMRFWLDMGVDGLRLDAIPYLCEREGTNNENLPPTHQVIKTIRAALDARYDDRMLLAEANQWPEDVREYFGDGDECHMAYHFPIMPRMYMAIAQEDRHPVVEIMEQTPEIPEPCQWAIFLRNHDELTLEMVTDRERDYMYRTYAADARMRINVGIRRRLAPLMDNDTDKLKLMNSLLLSMPGSPIIYYGDEIGMGDNIFLGDRNGVRTPMQWSPDRNAGFSRADPQGLYLPPIMDPVYGYEAVNVEAQSREPASLLNWMKRLIAARKAHRAFGRGSVQFLRPGNRKILAYVREYDGEVILCVANLARTAQPVELHLARFKGRVPVELLGQTPFPPIGELPYLLTLPRYGFYWFALADEGKVPSWHEEWLSSVSELPVLTLFAGWEGFFSERADAARRRMAERLRSDLEQRVLPAHLGVRRWYAAKSEQATMRLEPLGVWRRPGRQWLFAQVHAVLPDGEAQRYALPLSLAWEGEHDEAHAGGQGAASLARVREQARMGVLYDAYADERFCTELVAALGEGGEVALDAGQLRFSTTAAYRELVGSDAGALELRRGGGAESSNTTLRLGERLFLKGYRRLRAGPNCELEMGRFLTEVSPYPHVVPLAGALEYVSPQGESTVLALLQGYVPNQGDAWTQRLEHLGHVFEQCLLRPAPEMHAEIEEHHAVEVMHMTRLGRRTAELHRALAQRSGDPAFDAEPVSVADLARWREQTAGEAGDTLELLQRVHTAGGIPAASDAEHAQRLLAAHEDILARVRTLARGATGGLKTRFHGDYHLGQVLVVEDDFLIIDFEGEPDRPPEQRRRKLSPLVDVAGMLRSFNYAAEAALQRATVDREHDRVRLVPFAEDWEQRVREAFLRGYRDAAAGSGLHAEDSAQRDELVELFCWQKACYELRYELAQRPEWVGVPLRGLLALLARGHGV
jgi:maltose alpha-D-glucosyltransferase/alpha-amylase